MLRQQARRIYKPANPISFQHNDKSSAHRENKHVPQTDSKMSDSVYFGKTKDRKKNYSESEASLINQYILIHHDELYGLNGQDTTPAQRLQLWQNLTNHVNALGVEQRTVLEIKKRWQVVKVRVKKLLTPQKGAPVGHLTTEEAQIACLIFPHLIEDMGLPDGENRGSVSSGSEDEAGPSPAVPQTDHAARLSQLQLMHMEHVSTSSSEEEAEEEEEGHLQEDPPQRPVHQFSKMAMNTRAMPRMPSNACDTRPTRAPKSSSLDRVPPPPANNPVAEYNGRRRGSKPRPQRRTPPDQGWHKILFRQQEEAHTSFAAMLKSLDKMADCLCNVPEQITDLSKKMEEHNTALMQHLRDESAARRAFEEKLLEEQRQMREQISQLVESSVRSASTNACIANALERLVGQLVPREQLARQEGASTGSQWVTPPVAASQAAAGTAFQGAQPQMPASREETGGGWPEHHGRTGVYTRLGGWAACTSERRT